MNQEEVERACMLTGLQVIAEMRVRRNLRRRRFLRLAIALLIDAAIAGAFYAIFNLIWR